MHRLCINSGNINATKEGKSLYIIYLPTTFTVRVCCLHASKSLENVGLQRGGICVIINMDKDILLDIMRALPSAHESYAAFPAMSLQTSRQIDYIDLLTAQCAQYLSAPQHVICTLWSFATYGSDHHYFNNYISQFK